MRPGCGKRHGLEVTTAGSTSATAARPNLDNLARLCPEHHDLKTYGGWRLEGGPGIWRWIAPAHPKSAPAIARARKLAAIKAKAKANLIAVSRPRSRPVGPEYRGRWRAKTPNYPPLRDASS